MALKKIISRHRDSIVVSFGAIVQTLMWYYLQDFETKNVISSREKFFLFIATFFISWLMIKFFLARHEPVEQKAETFIVLLLLIVISLVFAYITEELFELDTRIEQAKVIGFILAGSVGLFGFTVAYLNYRRKSGVALECIIQKSAKNDGIELHFLNLKDRPIVLFEFILITRNVEIYYRLPESLILNSYGAGAYLIEAEEYILNYLDDNREDILFGKVKAESGVPENLFTNLQNEASGIRAKTNRGVYFIEIKSLEDLSFKKEIRLESISGEASPPLGFELP